MGHNNITVNNFEPDIESSIDFTTTTPTILIGRNHSQAYSSNPASPTLGAGDTLYVYDPSPINTISGASISSSNNWASSVTLPAGTYVMSILFSVVFTASGSMQYGFKYGQSWAGSLASCGGDKNVYLSGGGVSVNTQTLTSDATFIFGVFAANNVASVANQGNIPAEQSYVLIQQL